MLLVKFDASNRLTVELSLPDNEVVALGKAYVAYESGLALADRLCAPSLDLIQTTLSEARAAIEQATVHENLRATAATDYQHASHEATALMKTAVTELKYKYRHNQARLREWGLKTVVGKRGKVRVISPLSPRQWADFMHAYIGQEQSLPEANRIADPPLARLMELDGAIQHSLTVRDASRTERGIGVQQRAAAVTYLRDLLQAAAVVLVVTRYHGCVVEELTRWGYRVVEKAARPPAVETDPVSEPPNDANP